MTRKAPHNIALGKGGTIGFATKEAKEIRKNFVPVTNLDHLALYLDGVKFSPESFDRFFDSNLRKRGSQAFNLRWIKTNGTKVDQLALEVQGHVQGYENKDESQIIDDINFLVSGYPNGLTEYYYEATDFNNEAYKEKPNNANMSDTEEYSEQERAAANEAFEAGIKKALRPKTKIKKVVKTVTKTVVRKSKAGRIKTVITPELTLIKGLHSLQGKFVKTSQLNYYLNKITALVKRGNKNQHFQLLKEMEAKLSLGIFKLDGSNTIQIKNFQINKELFNKLNAVVKAPKVKSVTLGKLGKPTVKKKDKPTSLDGLLCGVEQYTLAEAKSLGIIDSTGNNLAGIEGKAKNPYDVINRIIIKQINKGVIPWEQPWSMDKGSAVMPQNFGSKRAYRGVNFWSLLAEMDERNHSIPYFLTSKQITEKGGTLIKGAKPYYVTYYGKFITTDVQPGKESKEPETEEKLISFLKLYGVYNVADTDGIEYNKPDNKPAKPVDRIESAEAIINNMPQKPKIKFGGNEASYSPSQDIVKMPKIENFKVKDRYYSTFFHELVHSTKNDKRCGTDSFRKNSQRFADKQYSWEELVAELGACYLCGEAGILHKTVQHSAAYAKGWANGLVKFIGNDKTYFFKAANYAQKAADFILNKQTNLSGLEPGSNANDSVTELRDTPPLARKTNKQVSYKGYEITAHHNTLRNTFGWSIYKDGKYFGAIKGSPFATFDLAVTNAKTYIDKIPASTMASDTQKGVASDNVQTLDQVVSGGTFRLDGDIGDLLGDLGNHECAITLDGDQGGGKTQLAWIIANAMANKGFRVKIYCTEMLKTSSFIEYLKTEYISPENQKKIPIDDSTETTMQKISDEANDYDFALIDSCTNLQDYDQFQFTKLFKSNPTKKYLGLFQRTTSGEIRGGNKPVFDSYVNLHVAKVDDTFVNNYAYSSKNRFGAIGPKFNISKRKKVPANTSLSGVARSKNKTAKKVSKKKGVKNVRRTAK
ncbi:MAG: zincin-like metallopeptidase domain-containing protein [Bacteroidota bacterium]